MAIYAAKRVLQLVPVLFIVSLIVFFIVHLIPGDPVAVILGEDAQDARVYEALRKELGLDRPIHVQYLNWLGRVLQGDLGQSPRSRRPVLDIVVERYPPTIYLASGSLFLGILIAIPAGTLAAVKQNTAYDYGAMLFALFGVSVPNFFFAILLILGLGVYLGWLPTIGYVPPGTDFLRFLQHLALPAVVLGTDVASSTTRFVRAEMLDQLRLDYVRTARAKGLPPRVVLYKHALRNSLIAATTVIGLFAGRLLGGSTVIETVFAWPGLARLVLEAVYARDYPVLQGAVLFLAVSYVFVNLLVDLLYQWLNPRIRLA
ncbi:MAG TPA: ABC transporter permease [Candidatus Eisenbacteria bacterium]|nr:ABC transporter permease [Candidatus Eisenbacteria bacterium]